MKNLVEDKVFKDELELWFFLQSLKGQKLGVRDGFYSIELSNSDEGLRYKETIFQETRKSLRNFIYDMVIEFRFYCFVKNSEMFCLGIDSLCFRVHEEVQDGVWQLLGLRDELSPAEGPHRQFTESDFARACDALVKALVVSSKKIA